MERLVVGKSSADFVYMIPKMANRHGLIAGATGTGKDHYFKSIGMNP